MNVCLALFIRKCFCLFIMLGLCIQKLFFPLTTGGHISCWLLHPKFNRKLPFIFKWYVFETYL